MNINPLLSDSTLPQFSKIKPAHVEPAIDQLLADARAIVAQCLQATNVYTWENLVEPIDAIEDRLSKAWSPVSHLNAVVNNDELREVYNACLPKLSEYSTEMGQNQALFNAYQLLANSADFSTLDTAQQRVINNALRDFRLSGIDLPTAEQQRYKEILRQINDLQTKIDFSNFLKKV